MLTFVLGLGQAFQMYGKLPYLRWLLPNAPYNPEAATTAWYMPKALPNAMKPRVPGDVDEPSEGDDEAGIMQSVAALDVVVRGEIDRGIPPHRIVVGGFSQGCAISLVWGLCGKERNNVAGVVPLSGYFPLADRISALRQAAGYSAEPEKDQESKKWFIAHGLKDALVPVALFKHQAEELGKWVHEREVVEGHVYENMAHNTVNAELRDMLIWLEKLIPADG